MSMNVNFKQDKNQGMLTNEQVKDYIFKSQQGDKDARDILVERNIRLVWSVVQRFMNRGFEQEDLFQIGTIGLIKSIDKFDLSYDVRFSTYAVPMIIGEIQRFIRDDGSIKVSRSLKETANKIRRKRDELTKELGRSATILEISNALEISAEDAEISKALEISKIEISSALEISAEDAVHALEASKSPHSIHETVFESDGDSITLLDQIADEGSNWFDKITLEEAIRSLSERERLIVYLRYYKDQTQSTVAKRLGISQVQVSRLEKKILEDMKVNLDP